MGLEPVQIQVQVRQTEQLKSIFLDSPLYGIKTIYSEPLVILSLELYFHSPPFEKFVPDELFLLRSFVLHLMTLVTFNSNWHKFITVENSQCCIYSNCFLFSTRVHIISVLYMEEKRAHIFIKYQVNIDQLLLHLIFLHGFALQQGRLVSDVYIMISVFNYSKKDLFQCCILRLLVKFYKYFPINTDKGNTGSSFQKENSNKENIFFIFL